MALDVAGDVGRCVFCSVAVLLVDERKAFLVDGAALACTGCLGLIPETATILGPRPFSVRAVETKSKESWATERTAELAQVVKEEPVAITDSCKVGECEDKVGERGARGLCPKHYARGMLLLRKGRTTWERIEADGWKPLTIDGRSARAGQAPAAKAKKPRLVKTPLAREALASAALDGETVQAKPAAIATRPPLEEIASHVDREVAAMATLVDVVEGLEEGARRRVTAWLVSRFGTVRA